MAILLLAFASNDARADCPAAPIADPDDMVVSFLALNGTQAASGTLMPSTVKEGMLVYDETAGALKICDGTNWVGVGSGGGDTLAGLSCAAGEIVKFNGSIWACSDLTMGNGGDPYWNNVVLLQNFDSDTSDQSSSPSAVTPSNGAAVSATDPKFGAGSLQLNGTNQFLSIADSAKWFYSTGAFTIEFWMKTTDSDYSFVVSQWQPSGGANRASALSINNSGQDFNAVVNQGASAITTSGSTGAFDGSWHHVAWVKDDTSMRLYVDGTEAVNGAGGVTTDSGQPLRIGTYDGTGYYYGGLIDEMRITKGVARYTSDFTPPTAPFPAFEYAEQQVTDTLASLSCSNGEIAKFDGTDWACAADGGGGSGDTGADGFEIVTASVTSNTLPSSGGFVQGYGPVTNCPAGTTILTTAATSTKHDWTNYGYNACVIDGNGIKAYFLGTSNANYGTICTGICVKDDFGGGGGSTGGSAGPGPSFLVDKGGTNQTVSSTESVITWPTEDFDTNANFAANRFTPTVAGKYLITLNTYVLSGTHQSSIFKNTTRVAQSYNSATNSIVPLTAIVDMNGTTDYIEAKIDAISGTVLEGLAHHTYMSGALIGGGGSDTLSSLSCSTNEIPKWNGSAWECAADGGGSGSATPLTGRAWRASNYSPAATTIYYDLPLVDGHADLSGVTHSTSVNPERMTVTNSGKYLVSYGVTTLYTPGNSTNYAQIAVNGVAVEGSGSWVSELSNNYSSELSRSVVVTLNGGDYVTLQVMKNAGTNTFNNGVLSIASIGGGSDTLSGLSCATNEIPKWDGSAWACAADGGGAGSSTKGIYIDGSLTIGTSATVINVAATRNDFSAGDWVSGVFTVPAGEDGWYMMSFWPNVSMASGQSLSTAIRVNGAAVTSSQGGTASGVSYGNQHAVSHAAHLEAGDTVSFSAQKTSAASSVVVKGSIVKFGSGEAGSDTLAGLSCATNEIPKWDGSAWACAADGGGSGNGPGSMVANWPDAIVCNVTSPANNGVRVLHLSYAPHSGGNYIYRAIENSTERAFMQMAMNSAGAFLTFTFNDGASQPVTSDCNNKSIATLYSEGKAFDLAGGGSSGPSPAVFAIRTTTQTISAGTWTNIIYDNDSTGAAFDTNSNFDTSNGRFTPTVAGKYIVVINATCGTGGCYTGVFKNGTILTQNQHVANNGGVPSVAIVDMNGTTDYVTGGIYSGGTTVVGGTQVTNFSASLIGGAGGGSSQWTDVTGGINYAGGNVVIGTASPDANAILDIGSTTKGVLLPRVPAATLTGMTTPSNGLIAYDSTNHVIKLRANGAWVSLGSGGGGSGGNTMVAGWPDAIKCNVTNPNWGPTIFYAELMPLNTNLYYYRNHTNATNLDVIFTAAGVHSGYTIITTTSDCGPGTTIAGLYSAGKAYNFVGGASAAADGTAGQVQFNEGGNLKADAALYWDNVNKRLGIGTATPESALHLRSSTPAEANITFEAYLGTAPSSGGILWKKARGTPETPSAVLANDYLFNVGARGYGDTGFSPVTRVNMGFLAEEDWTDTAQGTYIRFDTTPVGDTTRTERMRIRADGNVGIGTASPTEELYVSSADPVRTGIVAENTVGDSVFWAHASGPGKDALLLLRTDAGGGAHYWHVGSDGSDDNNFKIGQGAFVGGSTALTISKAGDVGIGTTAPQSTLEVSGTGTVMATPTNLALYNLRLRANGPNGSTSSGIHFGEGTAGGAAIIGYDDGTLAKQGLRLYGFDGTNMPLGIAIDSNGNVGIGTDTPGAKLSVVDTLTSTAGAHYLTQTVLNLNPASAVDSTGWIAAQTASIAPQGAQDNNGTILGASASVWNGAATGTLASTIGVSGAVQHISSGTVTLARGVQGTATNSGVGPLTNAYGGYFETSVTNENGGSGNIMNGTGIHAAVRDWGGASTIANGYGLYTGLIQATNKWSIYASDATAPSYFAGNVGIGVINPTRKLEVEGNVWLSDASFGGLLYLENLATWNGNFYLCYTSTPTNQHRVTKNATCNASDLRLKENIADSKYGLDSIMKLRPVDFDWKDKKNRGSERQVGLIAQEVAKVIPEVVAKPTQDGEMYALRYEMLVAPLIKAVQELKAENDNLRTELKAANDNDAAAIEELRREIDALKAAR